MSISRLFITCVVFSVAGLPSCFSADQLYKECLSPLRCGSGQQVFGNTTYPFWGDNIDKPNFCGRTEFKLFCKDDENLTLAIGNLTLRVVTANLNDKTITVADESWLDGGCPKIWNFTGNKEFTLSPTTETTDLYDCARHHPISLSTIACESSYERWKRYHVFGPSNSTKNCTKVGDIPMLRSAKNDLHQSKDSNGALETALRRGFDLRYTIQDQNCQVCSTSHGICGSEPVSGNFRCLCEDKPHNSSCNINDGVTTNQG